MGRKVNPIAFRLGIVKDWQSRWYADRNYAELLLEDVHIRQMVGQRLTGASLSKVEIQRSANQIEITLHTAKPGIVIGKGGQAVDVLRRDLEQMTSKKVKINIEEVKQPELDAYLIAESIAEQLGRRVSYRRAMKQSVMRAQRSGAKGVKVRISGRLGGSEMARSVWEREGRVPLHTLRADIDYGQVHAHTTYGRIGVKVWIYKGDVIMHKGGDELLQAERPAATAAPRPERRDRRERTDRPEGSRPERNDRGGPRQDRNDRGGPGGSRGGGDRGGRGGDRGDSRPQQPQFGGAAMAPGASRGPRNAPVPAAQAPAPATEAPAENNAATTETTETNG